MAARALDADDARRRGDRRDARRRPQRARFDTLGPSHRDHRAGEELRRRRVAWLRHRQRPAGAGHAASHAAGQHHLPVVSACCARPRQAVPQGHRPGHRGRRYRARQEGARRDQRPAHPHHPQRRGPRHRGSGDARRGRQTRRGNGHPLGQARRRPHPHRDIG